MLESSDEPHIWCQKTDTTEMHDACVRGENPRTYRKTQHYSLLLYTLKRQPLLNLLFQLLPPQAGVWGKAPLPRYQVATPGGTGCKRGQQDQDGKGDCWFFPPYQEVGGGLSSTHIKRHLFFYSSFGRHLVSRKRGI